MIRLYSDNNVKIINNLGAKLHNNYNFKLDVFSFCYVCEVDNVVVGFVTYSIIYERAEVVDIIIDEDKRRLGYATLLLNKVIKDATKKECKNITLEVDVNNDSAIKLYEKLGFIKVSVRKNYYGKSDAYLMEKII